MSDTATGAKTHLGKIPYAFHINALQGVVIAEMLNYRGGIDKSVERQVGKTVNKCLVVDFSVDTEYTLANKVGIRIVKIIEADTFKTILGRVEASLAHKAIYCGVGILDDIVEDMNAKESCRSGKEVGVGGRYV